MICWLIDALSCDKVQKLTINQVIDRKQVDVFNSLLDRYEPHEETANNEEKEFAITVIIVQVFIEVT